MGRNGEDKKAPLFRASRQFAEIPVDVRHPGTAAAGTALDEPLQPLEAFWLSRLSRQQNDCAFRQYQPKLQGEDMSKIHGVIHREGDRLNPLVLEARHPHEQPRRRRGVEGVSALSGSIPRRSIRQSVFLQGLRS